MEEAKKDDFPGVYSLEGECALITGGGSGIGLGIAKCMAAAGARVVLTGRREEVLVDAVNSIGTRADYVSHDVTELDKASQLINSAESKAGQPLSILVNNAGVHLKKPAVDTSPADFQAVMDTHVMAAHALNQAIIPGMQERGKGSIIMIASMASFMGIPLVVAYSAAKSAYLGMMRSLAAEVSGSGIRVNAIAPGWIETPMLRQALHSDLERQQKIISRTPMKTFGKVDDIGWTATFLCSSAARFITGTCVPVDGGAAIGF